MYILRMRLHVFKIYKIGCDTNSLHSETSSGKIAHYDKRRNFSLGFQTKFQVGFNETALIPLKWNRSDTAQVKPLWHRSCETWLKPLNETATTRLWYHSVKPVSSVWLWHRSEPYQWNGSNETLWIPTGNGSEPALVTREDTYSLPVSCHLF